MHIYTQDKNDVKVCNLLPVIPSLLRAGEIPKDQNSATRLFGHLYAKQNRSYLCKAYQG